MTEKIEFNSPLPHLKLKKNVNLGSKLLVLYNFLAKITDIMEIKLLHAVHGE